MNKLLITFIIFFITFYGESFSNYQKSLNQFFEFSKAPILSENEEDEFPYTTYVGENFKLKNNNSKKNLTWQIEKVSDGLGKLSLKDNFFSVVRSQKNDKATAYKLTVLDSDGIVKKFLFKVLTKPFKIMSWNVWGGEGYKTTTQPIESKGWEKNFKYGYFYKGKETSQKDRVAIIIEENDIDIVGLQETYGQINFLKSKTDLKNSFWGTRRGDSVSILSRFKISNGIRTGSDSRHIGAEVNISKNRKLVIFSTHFTASKSTQFHKKALSDKELVKLDKQYRMPSLKKLLRFLNKKYDSNFENVPIIITGDHNAGSHLDFTTETIGLPQNYGRGKMVLPLSKFLICNNGYVDSFRQIHPSPIKKPGHTYSSIYHSNRKEYPSAFLKDVKKNKYGDDRPHFRIDYIYAKGKKLYPVDSYIVNDFDNKVVILPQFENGKLKKRGVYVFPSDHSAVVTTYEWLD